MENVPGLAAKRQINGANTENICYLKTAVAKLLSMGYNVRTTKTCASHFGDPQERKRLVLLASKQGYVLPLAPLRTHGDPGDGLQPIVTVHDVLHDLEGVEPNFSGRIKINGKTVSDHSVEGTKIANISDNDVRLKAWAPAQTVRKKNKIVHYEHSLGRYLTLLERKRLMSFPDEHVLCGKPSEIRDQIGNAVPCRFAESIGKAIMESYNLGKYTLPSNDD
jgi:DNA (cytosine-5)-methyltransferase 1